MANQRVAEALSLREYFQEQWDHILKLVEDRQQQKQLESAEQQKLRHAVETMVEGTDSRLRSISNYQKQLRECTGELLYYIEGLVAKMPSPLLVNHQTLVRDPVVRTMFKSSKLVNKVLYDSLIHKHFLKEHTPTPEEVYALLFLFKDEKRILGSEMREDILVGDVLQTMVSFVGHEVTALCPSEEDVRSILKRMLFENVVRYIRMETTRKRHALSQEERLAAALNPSSNINNPAVYLTMLKEILAAPKQLITDNNQEIRINKMGIKIEPNIQSYHTSSVETLEVNEVSVGDNLPRIFCMIRYPIHDSL